jgi:hypothetical protein
MRRTTLILAVISLVFALFVFYSLTHLEPIHISDARLEHLQNAVIVRGTAINHGSQIQDARLHLQLFDSAGRKLESQKLNLGKLDPGKSATFSSHPMSASKAEKFTIQVDHGTNMYGN